MLVSFPRSSLTFAFCSPARVSGLFADDGRGRRARRDRFDVRRIVRAHLDLYRELLNRGPEA